jgi:branched-chain amino acid transport system permease protein
VLLDEPAAGLAEAESQQLAERIAEIPVRFGCSVLLIEHDMAHVRAASGTVTALSSGRVIASGRPDEVLAHRDVVDYYLGPQVGA